MYDLTILISEYSVKDYFNYLTNGNSMTPQDKKSLDQLQTIYTETNSPIKEVRLLATKMLEHTAIRAIEFLLSIIKDQQKDIGITYGERNRLRKLENPLPSL